MPCYSRRGWMLLFSLMLEVWWKSYRRNSSIKEDMEGIICLGEDSIHCRPTTKQVYILAEMVK